MSVLASRVNPRAEDFQANAAAMRALVGDLAAVVQRIKLGGDQRSPELRPATAPAAIRRLRSTPDGRKLDHG